MEIRIETWGESAFIPINQKYGKILKKYNLIEKDGKPYITLNSFQDLFNLHRDIEIGFDEDDDGNFFFGLITGVDYNSGENYIEIKDNYD